jgi:ABC-type uncharacterized transport system ATPase subunit
VATGRQEAKFKQKPYAARMMLLRRPLYQRTEGPDDGPGPWCSTSILAGDCRARRQARRQAWVRLRIMTEEIGVAIFAGTRGQGQRELVQLLNGLFEARNDNARD